MTKLQTYLKTLRVVLIPLTVFEIIYLGIILSDSRLKANLDENFHAMWVIIIFHILMMIIILWLNWTKLPIRKKMKLNNTYMVVFLGILGMWLWMPSSDDIDGLSEY